MTTRPLICGFIKVKDEIVREGNIKRAIPHLRKFCDTIVACDDASTDGTRQYLIKEIPPEQLILVPPEKHDFRAELQWKQKMLEIVHRIQPTWVWWHDADEELEPRGVEEIRKFCQQVTDSPMMGYRFHYTQYWRNKLWARTDDGFDDGWFLKLWRWSPGLRFAETYGTHHSQFPEQFHSWDSKIGQAPWEVLHWGNFGTNLRWKCIQYYGGLGGVERHLSFEKATYRPLSPTNGMPGVPGDTRLQPNKHNMPLPFPEKQKEIIRSMRNLKGLESTFTVVIPTYNRGAFLDETLKSLIAQTYPRWVALVLDDGSTDDTPAVMRRWQDADPRIFYARYEKLGAVAMNEIGMETACAWTEWWTRLGSDDYFEPHKLQLDAMALERHDLCYGSYRVLRQAEIGWQETEMCNLPEDSRLLVERLKQGGFAISWANIAARTSLLRKVKERYGNFCSPLLRNMEDFHVNSRLVRFAEPVWRGAVESFHDGEWSTIINPGPHLSAWLKANPDFTRHDAIWRVNPVGASSDAVTTGSEDELTRSLIAVESNATGALAEE